MRWPDEIWILRSINSVTGDRAGAQTLKCVKHRAADITIRPFCKPITAMAVAVERFASGE